DPRFPHRFSTLGIETDESAIDHWRNDLALVNRDAAIHDTTTDLWPHGGLVDFRVPSPTFLTRSCIDSIDDAPIRDSVHAAVPVEWRRFLVTAADSKFKCPSQTETADVTAVDLLQWTVACLAGRESVGQPFLAGLAGVF